MPGKSYLSVTLSISVILFLLAGGCGTQSRTLEQSTAAATATPRGVTGTIATGKTVASSSVNVAPGGGTIAVDKPGDPLNGMTVEIPAGAYTTAKQFKISYAPVESHTFGADFNPVTPMINIDAGEGYADEIIKVTIPVKIPADSFALGFIYDGKTKKLEALPLVAEDSSSITVGTRHFCNIIVSWILKGNLKPDIDSQFRPGIDDWQIPNPGSCLNPGGDCSGHALTALWYYCTQPDGKDLTLYGRYDNNGVQPATPGFWWDDSRAFRLGAVVQNDVDFLSLPNKIETALAGVDDEYTFNAFAYAMQLTGEPQELGLFANAGGGHDMICYRVQGNKLHIADPNYPGDTERRITFSNKKLQPYVSSNVTFETIEFCAKSATIDWGKIAERWAEFKDKTIGKDLFPAYKIVYLDEKGQYGELKDGTVVSNPKIKIGAEFATGNTGVNLYRDGKEILWDADGAWDLKSGANLLGVFVRKPAGANNAPKYVDFQYINVIYGSLALKPATQEAWPGKTITFDLELTEAAPKGAKFEWYVDGVLKKSGYDFGIDVSFPDVGTHTIIAKVVDSAGKVLMQAQGTAVIKALTTTTFVGNNLTALQKMKTFLGNFQGQCNIKEKTDPVFFSVSMSNWSGINLPINITWSGASFSGTETSPVDGGTHTSAVNGTVSGDGKTFTSLTFTYSRKSNYTGGSGVVIQDNTITVQLKNIPIIYDLVWEGGSNTKFDFYQYGPEVKSYLVKYEQHMLTTINGKVSSESTYLSDTINWNWSGSGLQGLPQIMLHFK